MDLLIIAGPTASGKSSLAVKCAKVFNGEIISADSMQIYKQMNVGTAKVTEEEQSGVVHHLLDIVEPDQEFSVSDFVQLANSAIEDIKSRGKLPIIVGGTGLYIKALLYDYNFAQTNKDTSIRDKYQMLLQTNGAGYLHDLLESKDPIAASNIHMNATKRVIRALEIIEQTGLPLNQIQQHSQAKYDYTMIILDLPREVLYQRINDRVDKMLKDGIIEEMKHLMSVGVDDHCQSFQAIGYKEFLPYINKNQSLEECIQKLKQNTRNYAKRQITYLKSFENAMWLSPYDESKIMEYIKGKL